jgi:hypothetical protein
MALNERMACCGFAAPHLLPSSFSPTLFTQKSLRSVEKTQTKQKNRKPCDSKQLMHAIAMVHKMQRLALSSGQRPSQAAAEAGLLAEAVKEEAEEEGQASAPACVDPEPVDAAQGADGAAGDGVESQGKLEPQCVLETV